MKKWEYMIVRDYIGSANMKLEKLGSEGWELVSAFQDQTTPSIAAHVILYLKRYDEPKHWTPDQGAFYYEIKK